MAVDNNIFIRITGQTNMDEVNKKLDAGRKRLEEYSDDMMRLAKDEADAARYIREHAKEYANLDKALNENAAYYKKLRNEIKSEHEVLEKSIETLEQNSRGLNLLNGSTKSATTQIREMRNVMMEMEEAGNENSEVYQMLAVRASQMSDQFGDLQNRIRILASDTRDLDGAMSVGSGVAGAFNVATSAAELLGGETEGLQKAFYKVQATLSILNGVQEIANVLNKDSAANVVINNALQRIRARVTGQATAATAADAAVTGAATKAQVGLNAAMLANPALWLVAGIVALVAGIGALVDHYKNAKIEQRAFNRGLEETKRIMSDTEYMTDYRARLAEAYGKSEEEIYQIQRNGLRQQRNAAVTEWNRMVAEKKKNNGRLTDEEKEAMDELKQTWQQLDQDIRKLDDDRRIQRVANQTRENEELLEKQREYRQRRKDEIEQAERELQDVRISIMADGIDKEIAQINLDYSRRISAIVGNSEAETSLRVALETEREQRIAEARKNASKSAEDEEKDKAREQIEREKMQSQTQIKVLENMLKEEKAARIAAGEDTKDIDEMLVEQSKLNRDIEYKYLDDMLEKSLISREEYEQQVAALNGEAMDELIDRTEEATRREAEAAEKALNDALEGAERAIQMVQNVLSTSLQAAQDLIQQQIDALDEMYTTDATEAAKNAKKKLISEEEYEKKKAALEMKRAKFAKAQAITDIGLQTALAIITTIGQLGATPWGIASAAIAAAMGAVQLGVAMAKPLAQYEKGRKGGPGEYALVGEKGPELMYVPNGASIVPNNRLYSPETWGAYGVPQLAIPQLPELSKEENGMLAASYALGGFDYDKLGKAVAANLPEQKSISVNVDRGGVTISDGISTHRHLNKKYGTTWH